MKRIALITFATGVAVSHFAAAQEVRPVVPAARRHVAVAQDNGRAAPLQNSRAAANVPHQLPARVQQLHRNPPGMAPGIDRSPRFRGGDFNPAARTQPPATSAPGTAEQNQLLRSRVANDANAQRDWRNRAGNDGNADWRNRTGTGGQDWRNRNGGNNQARNREDWRRHNGDGEHNWHHDWDRNHHDRDWWRSRYDRFAFFGGGYYFWDAGFWYPAYGYDPVYSTYAYDAPIYGYDSSSPAEVMSSVQEELARRGYYYGAIDGTYGPLTREALLRYQQSAGLAMTGLLDQATLESLGID